LQNKLKQLAREPLIHFLLIGAGIYLLYGLSSGSGGVEDERTVTVTAGDIQALSDQWSRVWNRPPTQTELTGAISGHVRVQILYREAVAMGLDVGDTVIERRLAQKLELLARGLITPQAPTDETLEAWYEDRAEQFTDPDLFTITQIFFDPDRRGDTTLEDAHKALTELEALDALPENLDGYGDRIMLQNHYSSRSELGLGKLFGTGFADQVVTLEPGRWHGPVLSGYGTHLVLIHDVVRSSAPAFEDIRAQITEQWMAEQIETLSDRFVDELVARYEVVVEESEVPVTIPGAAQ